MGSLLHVFAISDYHVASFLQGPVVRFFCCTREQMSCTREAVVVFYASSLVGLLRDLFRSLFAMHSGKLAVASELSNRRLRALECIIHPI